MIERSTNSFRVGRWQVEPALNEIVSPDKRVRLEPRTMDVLALLYERQGAVVSADTIIEQVWSGRPMGDNPVYKAVAKIRQALEDDPKRPKYLLTVPKKGYRLVVDPRDEQALAAKPSADGVWGRLWPIAAGLVAGFAVAVFFVWKPAPEPVSIELATAFAGSHTQPSFSPDGESLAFVSDASEIESIWVLDAGEASPRKLTSDAKQESRPRWAPDGASILFQREGSLWSASASGGTAVEIIRNGYNANWSRDGRKIVFERRYQLWLADADGGNQQRVEGPPRSEIPLSPRWPALSPDGSSIVYFEPQDSPAGDLWIIPSAGGEPQQLTQARAFGGAPVWSPDGRYVYYTSLRGGSRTLWRVRVEDGEASPLLVGSGDDDFADVSPDGTRVVYANSREIFHIVETDPDTGDERRIYDSRLILIGPEISPDGNTLLFFGGARFGGIQIMTVPMDGGESRFLTNDSGSEHAIARWSGDGRSVYHFRTGRNFGFAAVGADGGEPETLVEDWDWNTANGAAVDPSGRFAMYSRLTGQAPVQTLLRDLATGEDAGFHATLEYPRWSRSSEHVIGSWFVDQRFPGDVAICAVDVPECRVIAESGRVPRWSHDESRVHFVRGFGASQDLFVVDADGGNERFVMTMAPLFPLGPFYSVTADGKVIWVRYEKQKSDIWIASLPEN